jgi:hypothetical protein
MGEESIIEMDIGQDRLQQWLSQMNAQKSVLLVDACGSGSPIGDKIALHG